MATRVDGVGTVFGSATGGAITMPTHAAGDLIIIAVGGKYAATTSAVTASGFTAIGARADGGTVTTGNDAGDSFVQLFAKVATSSSETSTASATAANSLWAIAVSWRPVAGGSTWADAAALGSIPRISANDTTAATPLTGSATFSPQPSSTDGLNSSQILAFGAFPSDLGSAISGGSVLPAGGALGGASSIDTYVENSLGADSGGACWFYAGFTGTATGATTMSATITGLSNNYGPLVAIWLRETPPTSAPKSDYQRTRRIRANLVR